MSTVQDGDELIVSRGGQAHKSDVSTYKSTVQDDDLLIVQRGGQSYKCRADDLQDFLGEESAPVPPYSGSPGMAFASHIRGMRAQKPSSDPVKDGYDVWHKPGYLSEDGFEFIALSATDENKNLMAWQVVDIRMYNALTGPSSCYTEIPTPNNNDYDLKNFDVIVRNHKADWNIGSMTEAAGSKGNVWVKSGHPLDNVVGYPFGWSKETDTVDYQPAVPPELGTMWLNKFVMVPCGDGFMWVGYEADNSKGEYAWLASIRRPDPLTNPEGIQMTFLEKVRHFTPFYHNELDRTYFIRYSDDMLCYYDKDWNLGEAFVLPNLGKTHPASIKMTQFDGKLNMPNLLVYSEDIVTWWSCGDTIDLNTQMGNWTIDGGKTIHQLGMGYNNSDLPNRFRGTTPYWEPSSKSIVFRGVNFEDPYTKRPNSHLGRQTNGIKGAYLIDPVTEDNRGFSECMPSTMHSVYYETPIYNRHFYDYTEPGNNSESSCVPPIFAIANNGGWKHPTAKQLEDFEPMRQKHLQVRKLIKARDYAEEWETVEEKKVDKKRKRARNKDGTYKGDDPSTPEVNEAWKDGKFTSDDGA
nr:hypothetical protein [uncultured Mediterranean phage uvMED]